MISLKISIYFLSMESCSYLKVFIKFVNLEISSFLLGSGFDKRLSKLSKDSIFIILF